MVCSGDCQHLQFPDLSCSNPIIPTAPDSPPAFWGISRSTFTQDRPGSGRWPFFRIARSGYTQLVGQAALYADGQAVGSYVELRNRSVVPSVVGQMRKPWDRRPRPLYTRSHWDCLSQWEQAPGRVSGFRCSAVLSRLCTHHRHRTSSPPFIR